MHESPRRWRRRCSTRAMRSTRTRRERPRTRRRRRSGSSIRPPTRPSRRHARSAPGRVRPRGGRRRELEAPRCSCRPPASAIRRPRAGSRSPPRPGRAGRGGGRRTFSFDPGEGAATGEAADAEAAGSGRVTLAPSRSRRGAGHGAGLQHDSRPTISRDRPAEALRRTLLSTRCSRIEGGALRLAARARRQARRGGGRLRDRQHVAGARRPDDRAVLGAAIVLPDHPEVAPESLGNLFDNTEIEEALLLHVQALSDSEREAIADQDPAVREMIERADAVTNEEMLDLHGLMRATIRPRVRRARAGDAESQEPGGDATGGRRRASDEIRGEPRRELVGRRVRRGDKVVLRPGPRAAIYDKMLDGRTATIERIYLELRRPRLPRGDGRRRPRPGSAPRDRPLPLLLRRRGRAGEARRRRRRRRRAGGPRTPARSSSPASATLAERRRLRRPRRSKRLEQAELPGGVERDGLRHRRARPRLRGDARLRRADPDRRQPPGRRAGNALRDRAGPRRDRRRDRGRRGDQPARDGPADGAALRQGGRRLARKGRGRRLRARRRSRRWGSSSPPAVAGRRSSGRSRSCSSRSRRCAARPSPSTPGTAGRRAEEG